MLETRGSRSARQRNVKDVAQAARARVVEPFAGRARRDQPHSVRAGGIPAIAAAGGGGRLRPHLQPLHHSHQCLSGGCTLDLSLLGPRERRPAGSLAHYLRDGAMGRHLTGVWALAIACETSMGGVIGVRASSR